MNIRPLVLADAPAIKTIYKQAFACGPWFEDLSDEEIDNRWVNQISKDGFAGIVVEKSNSIAAALWWNIMTPDDLISERGQSLSSFAQNQVQGEKIIWEREVIVDPKYHGNGVGSVIRRAFFDRIRHDYPGALILTRMRDDNIGIIKIAQKIGFKRTGVRVPSSANPDLYHEYWYYKFNTAP